MERWLYLVIVVKRFLRPGCGRAYEFGFLGKLLLLYKIFRNCRHPESASSFLEMVTIAQALLELPAETPGVVTEFGCYKGISSANISLVCKIVKRPLYIFDSFCGLPEPDQKVTNIVDGREVPYKKGDFSASLVEVQNNIRQFGAIDSCKFIPGYFEETLPTFNENEIERIALVFEDADLVSSVATVLRFAWPKLVQGGSFFCHEARDLEVIKLFFDDRWWKTNLNTVAPGLIGSGKGLPLGPNGCCMGLVIKNDSPILRQTDSGLELGQIASNT